jgi:hypothetical protein
MTQSDLSSAPPQSRPPPLPIETQLTSPIKSTESTRTPPSVGPKAYDETVVPPSHDGIRTLVLCFDGTGDQFDSDVYTYTFLYSLCVSC